MGQSIENPFPVFFDTDGKTLENGYIYIGESGLNPEVSPISTFWDINLLYPAPQPIRTINGLPSRSGTPSEIFTNVSDYSIKVENKNNELIYSSTSKIVGYTTSIASIANLRLTSGGNASDFPVIDVTGYYVPGDGGGGQFYWDNLATAADNNGTIIKVTGVTTGRWIRLYSGTIDFRWFGVKLDDSTDNTTTVQAAIDYAETLTDSGAINVEVYGPEGKCYIDTFTTLTNTSVSEVRKYVIAVPANITITGPIEFTYDVDFDALTYYVQVFTCKGSDITFDGPTFRNNTPGTQTGSIAVAMNTKHDDDIRTGTYKNLIARNCKFYDNIFSTQTYFRDWGSSTMKGYKVIDCYSEPGTAGDTGAFDAHGNEGTRMQNVSYLGSTVMGGTFASSFNLVGVQHYTVDGNTSRDNLYAACQAENWSNHGTITGNDFSGKDASSVHGALIWVDDSAHVNIDGNTINGDINNEKGIYITHEGFTESIDGVSQDHTAFVTDNINIGTNTVKGAGIISTSFGGGGGGSIGAITLTGGGLDASGISLAKAVALKPCISVTVVGGKYIGGTTTTLEINTKAGQLTNVHGVTTEDGGDGGDGYDLLSALGGRLTTGCMFNNGINTISGSYTSINDGPIVKNDSVNGILRGIGSLSPEGVVTAAVGSIFQRTDGGVGFAVYSKESGSGNTGWVTLTTSSGTTGGIGSAGAGTQYVEANIEGATYKLLHDGTV